MSYLANTSSLIRTPPTVSHASSGSPSAPATETPKRKPTPDLNRSDLVSRGGSDTSLLARRSPLTLLPTGEAPPPPPPSATNLVQASKLFTKAVAVVVAADQLAPASATVIPAFDLPSTVVREANGVVGAVGAAAGSMVLIACLIAVCFCGDRLMARIRGENDDNRPQSNNNSVCLPSCMVEPRRPERAARHHRSSSRRHHSHRPHRHRSTHRG